MQYFSLCVSAVVIFLDGSDHMEVDEQDREQVDSERESAGARSKETTNVQTCVDMCMSDNLSDTRCGAQGQMCRESLV